MKISSMVISSTQSVLLRISRNLDKLGKFKEIHSGVKTNVKIGIRMDIITKQSCQNNVIWNSMYVCLEVLG
jgi:hypothetical protein